MKRKYQLCKYVIVFLSTVSILIGCYSKENLVQQNLYPYQEVPADNISNQNVNKFLSSIRKIDGDAEAKYQMARYFQKKNKHKIAIEELKEVIQIDPTFVKAYNAMGFSYDQLWDMENAIKSYKLAIKLDPNLDYVYNNLGFSYLLSGDYDTAIDVFQKAIALDEQNKRYHNNLGLTYAKKGEFELALEQFRLTGDESDANYKLGQILFKEGKYDLARKYTARSFQMEASANVTPSVQSAEVEKNDKPKIIRKSIRQESELAKLQNQGAEKSMEQNLDPRRVKSGPSETPRISENQMLSIKNNKDENNFSKKEQLKKRDFAVEVEIEISNGNGVNGMANRLGHYLRQKGFKVTRLKNARYFNHKTTKIFYYSSHSQDVARLLQEIPVQCDKQNIIELERLGNHIKILIGEDMIPYDSIISKVESLKNPS